MKKLAPWLITILLSITLIVVAALLLLKPYMQPTPENEVRDAVQNVAPVAGLTADQIVEVTSTIDEIKTNAADANYIVVANFAFQLDSAESKAAFDKIKDFKIAPIIIKTLADTKPEELNGAKGKDDLSAKLLNLINKSLPEGKVIQIDITKFQLVPI
jgi:flagellar FliL protein